MDNADQLVREFYAAGCAHNCTAYWSIAEAWTAALTSIPALQDAADDPPALAIQDACSMAFVKGYLERPFDWNT